MLNVQVDGTDLVWTETNVAPGLSTTDIYRATLPVSAGAITPVFVRTAEFRAQTDSASLGAGILARYSADIELVRIADGARWLIDPPEPWQVKSDRPMISERSMIVQLFDRDDLEQNWVTFRAKVEDVIALPSD